MVPRAPLPAAYISAAELYVTACSAGEGGDSPPDTPATAVLGYTLAATAALAAAATAGLDRR